MITVNRFVSDEDTTISQVFVRGKFVCFGLEDEFRFEKLIGETRIPAGTYRVGIRRHGGMNDRYKKRFGIFHRGIIEILNVPGFTDILIHCGNYDKDTAGCLLVGTGAVTDENNMMITNSVVGYKKLYDMIFEDVNYKNTLIQFIDSDL